MVELKGLIPFGSICAQSRNLLVEKTKESGLDEVKLLVELEKAFCPQAPDALSVPEILDLMGITESQWGWILDETTSGDWKHLSLNRVSKDLFWAPDVVRLTTDLLGKGWLSSNLPLVLRQFERLVEAYCKPAAEVVVEVPPPVSIIRCKPAATPKSQSDLPVDYNDLHRKYSEYIGTQIRRYSKIRNKEELQEVYQQVWVSLMGARILAKFTETAETVLPSTLTFPETLAYLGVTEEQWWSERKNSKQWVPDPISGSTRDGTALYLTTDIETLDVSGFLKNERGERSRPGVTGRGFKSYLAKAVRNHFYNLLRTRSRRHKERGVDSSRRTVVMNSTGACSSVRSSVEDGNVWEENITDEWKTHLPMEDMVDLSASLKEYDLDPNQSEDLDILDSFLRNDMTLKETMRKYGRELRKVQATVAA